MGARILIFGHFFNGLLGRAAKGRSSVVLEVVAEPSRTEILRPETATRNVTAVEVVRRPVVSGTVVNHSWSLSV